MTWRDDDVLVGGVDGERATLFLQVDDMFQKYQKIHTVGVIVETLDDRLADVILRRRMIPQLHCWTHDDFTKLTGVQLRQHLERAIVVFHQYLGVMPTVLYPPWNRTSVVVTQVASELGLKVSRRVHSLLDHINNRLTSDTVLFHHWNVEDVNILERALACS